MTPIRFIRQVWERRWARHTRFGFGAAGSLDTKRALQLFEPHVIHQSLDAGPRLGDTLNAARWIQGLTGRPPIPVRFGRIVCRPRGFDGRAVRPRSAPLRLSHRRVVIRT